MAKFHSYYVLCPLIDQNSFLGVSEDKDSENVLVTLGRNVVNKYRLSDQKQIGGWTSKDHITSTVIFDTEQESYIGVFNKNTIKAWKNEGEDLDKLKKYKFSVNILQVVPRKNQTSLIIFENGDCASLPYGVENRKTYENKHIIKESESIVETGTFTWNNVDYICYVLRSKSNKEKYEILTCPVRDELGDLEKAKLTREKITRPEDVQVVAHLISNTNMYIIWSDSKMSIYNIIEKSWKNMVSVPWISTLTGVSLAQMDKNHLIMFGSNIEQDGAVLFAYNVVLGVGSCRYPMKMYTKDAKIYCFNERIVLQGSNHIAMVPYVLETERNLSTLLGSHDVTLEKETEIADWGTPVQPLFPIGDKMKDLWSKGLTERSMFVQLMSSLMEKNDYKEIYRALKEFSDVPESALVSLLIYGIKLVNPNHVDITDEENFRDLCSCKDLQGSILEEKIKQFEFLNYLFSVSFSDSLIIPHLRNNLSLDNALFLMTYIAYLVSEKEIPMEYESKLYDWCILLMDTFYQQYLMTKDNKVSYVLEKLQKLVLGLIENINTIDKILPSLDKLIHGTPIPEEKAPTSYAIELLKI